MNKQLIPAIATLIGTIVGAGILGIPFVVAKAGFLTSVPLILLIGVLMLVVNLCLGEITLRTKGTHQLTGYMEKYLGSTGKFLMMLSMIFGIYGALIAYMIGVGQSLNAIFGGGDFIWSIIFFVFASLIVYGSLEWLKESETLLMFFLLIIFVVITLSLFLSGFFSINKLIVFRPSLFMLPFGVVLFAYLGTSAIPMLHQELGNKKLIKQAILLGSLIPIIIYFLFALSVVGVSGENTTGVATVGIGALLGKSAIIFFNAFATLTMTTSFISLGFALKNMYKFDYSVNHKIAWFLTVIIPFLLFILSNPTFTSVLSITGTFTGGLAGVLILIAFMRAKKMGERKPEYSMNIPTWLVYLLSLVFILGAIFELGII